MGGQDDGIASRLENGWLKVAVTDRGPGTPADQAEKAFLPFYRVHNGTREGATGTGLGLSIARDLAVRSGGDLRLLPSSTGAVFGPHRAAPITGHRGRAFVPARCARRLRCAGGCCLLRLGREPV